MIFHWSDAVGVLGTALILLAFFLLQMERMRSQDLRYSILNGLGAALILFSLAFSFNLSAFIIEVFWVLISLIGILRHLTGRQHQSDRAGS
jgi:multidrug transporter EmrE-like cation transporter